MRNEFVPSQRQVILQILKRGEIRPETDINLVSEIIASATWYCVLVGSTPLTDRHATRMITTIVDGVLANGAGSASSAKGAPRRTRPSGPARRPTPLKLIA